jgi:short subunit dehydrogenase-like uncharacterized protein
MILDEVGVRITEVALLAGVSIATVLRVINGKYVNGEIRRKVEQVIDAHGYKPNRYAQYLGRHKSSCIREKKERISYVPSPVVFHMRTEAAL